MHTFYKKNIHFLPEALKYFSKQRSGCANSEPKAGSDGKSKLPSDLYTVWYASVQKLSAVWVLVFLTHSRPFGLLIEILLNKQTLSRSKAGSYVLQLIP
jgi:hypothetical protein